nr:maturase K [Eriocaulon alpestre]ULQ65231.1 maturase K [Eriocaulon alpestre]UVH66173.1 maturase K [Eriocaulon alpestre]UVH66258.1 maturase K [Eriocaulon alpestre]
MKKLQGYLEKDKSYQQYFLYPLIFQEYVYVFAHDYCLTNCSFFYESVGMPIFGCDKKFSSVLLKRFLIQIYQTGYLGHLNNQFQNTPFIQYKDYFYFCFYSQMILESFPIIAEIPFSQRLVSFPTKKGILKYNQLRSIHSIFPFLEDHFSHLDYVVNLVIPYPINFEILVHNVQSSIKDIAFLHLLRFFLNEYSNWKGLITSKEKIYAFLKENKRFFFFLYNYYISEFEVGFLFLRKQEMRLQLTHFWIFLERITFYKKKEHFKWRIVYQCFLQKALWLFTDPIMYYVRYQGKAIMSSKGIPLFITKWTFYLVYFWQSFFRFFAQSCRVHINQLVNYSFYCLGYLSNVLIIPLLVRNQTLENYFFIDNGIHQLDTIAPTMSIMASLYKTKFCTLSGHPISQPAWTYLSDCDIIDRFSRICRNLLHYYSGSSKKRSLYRVKYILRLSCARTLARKHKSTVRNFLQKVGSLLLEEFFTEEEQLFSLHQAHRKRIWYFDIICIHNLVNSKRCMT